METLVVYLISFAMIYGAARFFWYLGTSVVAGWRTNPLTFETLRAVKAERYSSDLSRDLGRGHATEGFSQLATAIISTVLGFIVLALFIRALIWAVTL